MRLIGNDRFNACLTRWQSGGDFPNCLLLSGEDGCGRGYAARTAAAAFLGRGELIERRVHPDCIEINSGEKTAGVDEIRAQLPEIYRSGVMGARRAVIVYETHALSIAGINALLKSIEEPPADVMFVLTSRSLALLPATVRSRSLHLPVLPVSVSQASDIACDILGDSSRARVEEILSAYGGRAGMAIKILRDEKRAELFSSCFAASKKGLYEMVKVLCSQERSRDSLRNAISDLTALKAKDGKFGGFITAMSEADSRLVRNASPRAAVGAIIGSLIN